MDHIDVMKCGECFAHVNQHAGASVVAPRLVESISDIASVEAFLDPRDSANAPAEFELNNFAEHADYAG
ncbi:hypothetical protein A8W25_31465 [Streptomyces sp. ERV7]|nr:hypothetical protein A8W25_31450 [Streptomyces sp. ERV7]OAR26654.1 hypothetical protein A8W25_31465 [Streptomyces sp. ERV7]